MNRLLTAAALLCVSAPAFAQNVNIDVDDTTGNTTQVQLPGVKVRVNTQAQPLTEPAPPPDQGPRTRGPRPPPMQVVGADAFSIGYELKPQETLRLLSPEGGHADVWADDGSYVGGFELPCEVPARAGQFYRVIISANGAVVYDRKVELRQYYRTNVAWRGGAPAQVVVVAPQPMPMQVAMVDFAALVEAVNAESFSDAKLNVVRTSEGGLTVDQLGQLVDLFSFSADQLKVVEICNSRLVDRQNAFKLSKHFSFDTDKAKLKSILGK